MNELRAGDNAHSALHIKINNASKLSAVVWWALVHSLIPRANINQMPSLHQKLCYVYPALGGPHQLVQAVGADRPNVWEEGRSPIMQRRTMSMAARGDWPTLPGRVDNSQGHLLARLPWVWQDAEKQLQGRGEGDDFLELSWAAETNWIPFVFSYLLQDS